MRFGGIAGAQVTGAPLGQCHGGFDAGGLEEIGDVALDQLRLQRHGAGADHQFLLGRQRDRHAGGQVAQRLADAGRRLDHADAAAVRQRARHHADHLALRTPGAEAGRIGLQLGVGIADGGLHVVVQRTRGFNFFGHAGGHLPGSRRVFSHEPGIGTGADIRAGSDPRRRSAAQPAAACPRARSARVIAHTSSTRASASNRPSTKRAPPSHSARLRMAS
ncbi:hypothetical protein D3C71_1424440 [compost metagenome]